LFEKAVRSIPDRVDIQIIVVDNGFSPIGEMELPTKKNATITYMTSNSKMGAGHARNVGLSE
jgi:hypothetical protein